MVGDILASTSFAIQWPNITGAFANVMPLRIELSRFTLSRSQKRIIARNRDVQRRYSRDFH